jgi:ribonuclease HI
MQTVPAPGPPTIQLKVRSESSSGTPTVTSLLEISKRIGPAINTVAEYRALIEGLKLARSRGIQRIRVFLDSELVVDQVNGRARVGKEHIRPLHTEACSLRQEFPNIRISWVPRKWNAEADALATKALLGR